MKKVIYVIILIVCLFGLFGCDGDAEITVKNTVETDSYYGTVKSIPGITSDKYGSEYVVELDDGAFVIICGGGFGIWQRPYTGAQIFKVVDNKNVYFIVKNSKY